MNDVLYKKDNSREFYFLKLVIKCSRKPSETVQGQLIRDLILLVLVDKIGAQKTSYIPEYMGVTFSVSWKKKFFLVDRP